MQIIKKKYYKISFILASPLALGSGENDSTDKDLIRDANGKPYIPASSVAGVIRGYLESQDSDMVKKYLGDVGIKTANTEASQSDSSVIFYDAVMTSDKWRVSVRDSVALDEFKTAINGAKFDMEVLEPGVKFTTYVEQDFVRGKEDDYGREIVKAFYCGDPVFGGKGMRGYGRISEISAYEKEFAFPGDTEKWLEFDLFSAADSDMKKCELDSETSERREIRLALKQNGGISIRRYTTKVSEEGKTEPDMEQLTIGEGDGIPVIPGTSWAGAICHRMKEFGINTENKGSIFGYVQGDGADAKERSRILFGESKLIGGSFKVISRNAIDRFTSGTVDGALFTERTYYGGSTELVIGWKNKQSMPDPEQKALAAALADLHFGFLAVGGETSIGRGLFTIESINGEKLSEEAQGDGANVYQQLLAAIKEAF